MTTNGYRVSLGSDEKVLVVGGDFAYVCEILIATEQYTLIGCMLCMICQCYLNRAVKKLAADL